MSEITNILRTELLQNADEKIKLSGERFFKESVKAYGIKNGSGDQYRERALQINCRQKQVAYLQLM